MKYFTKQWLHPISYQQQAQWWYAIFFFAKMSFSPGDVCAHGDVHVRVQSQVLNTKLIKVTENVFM